MIKIMPFLFFGMLYIASCAHNNLEDHSHKSRTGWTKSQIMKKFGSPDETFEDTDYSYYLYNVFSKKNSRLWQVKYVFQYNTLIKVEESLSPKSEELDQLEKKGP